VIDVAIDRAGYQSKNSRKKLLFKFSSFFLLGQIHLRVFMVLLSTAYAVNDNSKKKTLFAFIRVELRALLSSGLPSRVRKVRFAKSRFYYSTA